MPGLPWSISSKPKGAQGLVAPTAALHHSNTTLPIPAQVILLWCAAELLPGWCCVPEARPGPELLPLVRRQEMLQA